MRRVVVFMGGSRDSVAAVQRGLPGAVKALAASGVLVPRAARSGRKATGFTHQPLAGGNAPEWSALTAELGEDPADTAFLVIPGLLRIGGSSTRRTEMLTRLAGLADEVCLVSVVGDQLTWVNDAYLALLSTWRVSTRLEGALPRLMDNDAFFYDRLLRPWYVDCPARFVAVPAPDLASDNPVGVVLRSAGVELARNPPTVDVAAPTRLGSVGVEANRLLSTYLRAAVPGFDPSAQGVVAAGRTALARAQKLGWCADHFWGWSRHAADQALTRFDASNQRFAQAVWGHAWAVPYPLERACTRVDFLDLDPQVVDQVQRYVVGTADRVGRLLSAAR